VRGVSDRPFTPEDEQNAALEKSYKYFEFFRRNSNWVEVSILH
jgi:hypothetical protein